PRMGSLGAISTAENIDELIAVGTLAVGDGDARRSVRCNNPGRARLDFWGREGDNVGLPQAPEGAAAGRLWRPDPNRGPAHRTRSCVLCDATENASPPAAALRDNPLKQCSTLPISRRSGPHSA